MSAGQGRKNTNSSQPFAASGDLRNGTTISITMRIAHSEIRYKTAQVPALIGPPCARAYADRCCQFSIEAWATFSPFAATDENSQDKTESEHSPNQGADYSCRRASMGSRKAARRAG